MKYLFAVLLIVGSSIYGIAQKKFQFGLLTGGNASTFTTTLEIRNSIASAIPPLNNFQPIGNFHAGFFFEKQFSKAIALRWEVQRSPGGATAYDDLEERTKRYKFFYASSPIILKIAPFQKKIKFPFQLEAGFITNLFLFDYGEDITFGRINKLEYSYLAGISRAIDDKWSISLRYSRGLTSFSQYDAGGLNINWTNQTYAISFSRSLFLIGKR